jgi:hypothetical protein
MPGSLEKLSPCTGPCVENVPALADVGPEAAPSLSIRLIKAHCERRAFGRCGRFGVEILFAPQAPEP